MIVLQYAARHLLLACHRMCLTMSLSQICVHHLAASEENSHKHAINDISLSMFDSVCNWHLFKEDDGGHAYHSLSAARSRPACTFGAVPCAQYFVLTICQAEPNHNTSTAAELRGQHVLVSLSKDRQQHVGQLVLSASRMYLTCATHTNLFV